MIDFQARIHHYLRVAARYTAVQALAGLDRHWQYQHDVTYSGDELQIQVYNGDIYGMTFDLAGRTIDAALLEWLHNEVTAWLTPTVERLLEVHSLPFTLAFEVESEEACTLLGTVKWIDGQLNIEPIKEIGA